MHNWVARVGTNLGNAIESLRQAYTTMRNVHLYT